MPRNVANGRLTATAVLALVASACSGNAIQTPAGLLPTAGAVPASARLAPRGHASQKIQHIVIIVQENRSFNDLFYGFPGATTATYGYDSDRNKIGLKSVGLETRWDLDHSSYSFLPRATARAAYRARTVK